MCIRDRCMCVCVLMCQSELVDPHGGPCGKPLRELPAVRLAWNAILLEYRSCGTHSQTFTELQSQWGRATALLKQAEEVMMVERVMLVEKV